MTYVKYFTVAVYLFFVTGLGKIALDTYNFKVRFLEVYTKNDGIFNIQALRNSDVRSVIFPLYKELHSLLLTFTVVSFLFIALLVYIHKKEKSE